MDQVLCFGEVLWDIIEGREHIGGAPFNFAAHLSKLGTRAALLTRVGYDRLGDEALARMRGLGINAGLAQRDPGHPTGTAVVTLDENGVPSYSLPEHPAWHFIGADDRTLDEIRAARYGLFYFGTLAQQNPVSRVALRRILEEIAFPDVFFDVNIRQSFYPEEVLGDSLRHTSILKLNDEEVGLIGERLFSERGESVVLRRLFASFPLRLILVTRGKNGCSVYKPDASVDINECRSRAVDTVGAGDAFSAGFIHFLLRGEGWTESARRGNILAEFVAAHSAAVPDYEAGLLRRLDPSAAPGNGESADF